MDDGTTGWGSVGYNYQIDKYDVTNSQYTEFLNAKDPTAPTRWVCGTAPWASSRLWFHQLQLAAADGIKYSDTARDGGLSGS